MPRVTQSHRDRQTARILAAAQLCFARRGFDGASMDEIIAEAGMSSSTVYRYFPEGKRSLVRAVIGRVMDPVVDWIAGLAEVDELPSFEDVFVTAVERSWVFGRRSWVRPMPRPRLSLLNLLSRLPRPRPPTRSI